MAPVPVFFSNQGEGATGGARDMKGNLTCLLAMMLVFASNVPSIHAQEFDLLVLDALSGKPYNDMRVTYFCEGEMWASSREVVTDARGDARVRYDCRGKRIKLDLWIPGGSMWDGKVEECGDLAPQDIEQIVKFGVISNPSAAGGIWCPTKVSKKLKLIPGQVVMFAKKPTWPQRNIAP